jgi:hypothetical protein
MGLAQTVAHPSISPSDNRSYHQLQLTADGEMLATAEKRLGAQWVLQATRLSLSGHMQPRFTPCVSAPGRRCRSRRSRPDGVAGRGSRETWIEQTRAVP